MKTSRYTEAQILAILRKAEGGMPVAQLCREHGMMPLPGNGLPANHERERVVLQVAGEVWRDGCRARVTPLVRVTMARDDCPDEGGRGLSRARKRSGGSFSRRMEPSAEEDVCRTQHAERAAELRR